MKKAHEIAISDQQANANAIIKANEKEILRLVSKEKILDSKQEEIASLLDEVSKLKLFLKEKESLLAAKDLEIMRAKEIASAKFHEEEPLPKEVRLDIVIRLVYLMSCM